MKKSVALMIAVLALAVVAVIAFAGVDAAGLVNSSPSPRHISLSSAARQTSDQTFPNRAIPCPASLDSTELEGTSVLCGFVTVPEDYDKPDGNQVELVYAVLNSTSLSPAPDPVVYLHGGPGSAELRSLAQMTERFEAIRQTRDVVIFDQRGTGFSNNRLTCDVEYATQQDDARDAFNELTDGSGNVESAVNLTLYQVCLDRFDEIGTDLTQYNTVNNARDVVNLVSALGYDTFNLYGFSYGTQLALEVMRRHPDLLRSVILDSVAPAHIKLYENLGQPNVEALQSLFHFCEVDPKCSAAYPNLQERFIALLDRLDESPLTTEDGRSISSANVIAAFRQSDIRSGLGGFYPLMIWELERGETTTLDAIINNKLPPTVSTDFDPVVLRYANEDLSADAALFIESGLALRQEARQLERTADRFLERGDAQIALDEAGSSPAARFDLAFHAAMNGEPLDRRLRLNEAYLTLPLQDQSVESVRDFVTANFQGSQANELLVLTDAMSDEDVADLAQIIFGKARDHAYLFAVQLALRLYVCQEHVPYNDIGGAFDAFAELAIPQVTRGKQATVTSLLQSCALFPTDQAADGFHDPVVSDIPALILLGSADTQTAISWGADTAQNLENSQLILFPETGHGAIRYSQCAKDVGAAFLNNPTGTVDSSCTEELLPLFTPPPAN